VSVSQHPDAVRRLLCLCQVSTKTTEDARLQRTKLDSTYLNVLHPVVFYIVSRGTDTIVHIHKGSF
jgi:hypothetical protein